MISVIEEDEEELKLLDLTMLENIKAEIDKELTNGAVTPPDNLPPMANQPPPHGDNDPDSRQ